MENRGVDKLIDKIGQKVGAATSTGTVVAGVSTYMEFLPALMGVLASAAGILVSCVVIFCMITKNRLEKRLLRDQIERIESEPEQNNGGYTPNRPKGKIKPPPRRP